MDIYFNIKLYKNMIPKIIVEKKISDKEILKLKGTFFTEDGFTIYDTSIDIYNENDEILILYRKENISIELKKLAIDNLEYVVKQPSNNRGIASGQFNEKKYKEITGYNAKKISKFKGYRIKKDGNIGTYKISMPVYSGIIGYFNYTDSKTKKTEMKETNTIKSKKNKKNFENSFPFVEWINDQYKKLIPKNYEEMKKEISDKYTISNTIFSTITVNKNFQTAMHKDKKDIGKLGNLIVFHKGEVKGGYILFPQYKIGIKVQDRDFLIMNVHEYHTNTSISGSGDRFSFVLYLVK